MKDGLLAPVTVSLKKAAFQTHYGEFYSPNIAKEGTFITILA